MKAKCSLVQKELCIRQTAEGELVFKMKTFNLLEKLPTDILFRLFDFLPLYDYITLTCEPISKEIYERYCYWRQKLKLQVDRTKELAAGFDGPVDLSDDSDSRQSISLHILKVVVSFVNIKNEFI